VQPCEETPIVVYLVKKPTPSELDEKGQKKEPKKDKDGKVVDNPGFTIKIPKGQKWFTQEHITHAGMGALPTITWKAAPAAAAVDAGAGDVPAAEVPAEGAALQDAEVLEEAVLQDAEVSMQVRAVDTVTIRPRYGHDTVTIQVGYVTVTIRRDTCIRYTDDTR
jgi:hypothetical protein